MFKIVDRYFLPILLLLFPRKKSQNIETKKINKVLILRFGALGDTVLLLPCLISLTKNYPDIKIDIVCWNSNFELIKYFLGDKINALNFISYKKPKNLFPLFRFAFSKRNHYDLVLDFEQYANFTALLNIILNPALNICFKGIKAKNKHYSQIVPYNLQQFEAESFLNLTKTIFPKVSLEIPARKTNPEKIIGIHPASKWAFKVWPKENFETLIKEIIKIYPDYKIQVFLGPNENFSTYKTLLEKIEIIQEKSLTAVIEKMQKLSLFISNDNGIMHLTGFLGIPTIGIFGPSNPAKWHALNNEKNVVSLNLPCSPCNVMGSTPSCSHNNCLNNLLPTIVLAKVNQLFTIK